MTDESIPSPSVGRRHVTPGRRQWVVDALCEAYATDQFSIQEFERRLDEAHRAQTEVELQALISDVQLPNASRLLAKAADHPSLEASRVGGLLAPGGEARLPAIDADRVPDRQFSVGVWSGRVRKGSWIPARRITALAFQGGVELDFREAVFGPHTIDVRALALMGGVHIIVPPNLRVETSGFAIMGGLEDRTEFDAEKQLAGPLLRIHGFACLGSVDIDVRLPGETSREARSRRRKERRAKRR